MSALSPFREDVELAGSFETIAYSFEDAREEGEAWSDGEAEPTPFATEAEAEEWQEDEGFVGLADPEAEVTHPILALFPLPRAVLEALAGGPSSAAVRLAVGAGFTDVNQLTNIVFYFRHPEMIGRKIQSDQRELAAEWISIRDTIVKPVLQAAPAPTPADSGGPPVVPSTPPAERPAVLSSSRLVWPDSTAEELAFMRAVYERHAQRARGDFVFDLPKTVLEPIEGHEARTDAAAAAVTLLEEARRALAVAHPRARIGILSAYRPATRQFTIWQGRNPKGRDKGSGFPYYYREAIAKGIVSAGDFSRNAVEKVAEYLGGYIASPGYSNHQDGLAFDFGVGEVGKGLGRLREGSWFHRWLQTNARRLGFHPLKTEAWHWTYHPPGGQSEVWADEVTSPAVRANRVEVSRTPLLSRHRGGPPDLILRWNDMPSVPDEIDVVVHLHGFWYRGMKLPKDIEPVSGLDLAPIKGATGQGRSRPTLTVLPRAHDTGVRQAYKQKDGSYKYGYNVMTFPALVTKDGLTDLVRLSLDRFAAEVGGQAPRIGRLILTAHSGGGKALLEILKHHDPHQVHVFDALYWPPGPLEAWARRHIGQDKAALAGATSAQDYMATRGGALRVFYQGRVRGGTRPFSHQLLTALAPEIGPELAGWYRVEASNYDHFQIPRRYGWQVLADASADVPDAYVEQIGRRKELEAELEEPEAAFDESGFEESEFEEVGLDEGELELEDFEEPPLNDLPEPVSATSEAETFESDWESAVLTEDDEEVEEDTELAYLDEAEDDLEELSGAFDAADLVGESTSVEPEEEQIQEQELEDEEESGVEAAEVELGEVEAFLEDLGAQELTVDEEAPTTVTFPSGATLNVVSGPTGSGEEHYDPNGTGNPLLDTSGAAGATRLSANFTAAELARSGGRSFPKARIDPRLVEGLQRLRDRVAKAVRITSGYRPYLYNVELYTKTYNKKPTLSRHSSGQAADVKIAGMTGMDIAKTAIDVLGPQIAVGIGSDYAHIDVRGQWARWTYLTEKAQSERAISEIDAYRKQRSGTVQPAPAPQPAPRPPSTAGVRLKRVKSGHAAYGGGRLDESLRRLVRAGSLSISERDIDTLQRIADTESSGLTNALNSWDNAVVSIAFKQWTLRWGELQDLIGRAPEAFARHGIRLAPVGTNYVFSSKGKAWTQRAIEGVPDKETLRNEDWGRRFFLAGLEPEAVAAAARKALEDIAKLEQTVRTRYGWSPHLESPRGRALLAELDNNRPAYAKDAVPRTLARAKERPGIGEDDFLEIFVAEIVAAYERREKDAEKGRRWTRKIMGR